ncbi:hypothetical protein ACFQZC_01390 [Streptacidiphilus monticola]
MPWFSRRTAPPQITRDDLDRFGRHAFDTRNAGDAETTWAVNLTMRAYQWGQADRAAFMAAMVDAATHGQWAALGAERMVIEALGFLQDDPSFDTVMEHSLRFLRSRGIPKLHITGYEAQWWAAHAGNEPWLVGRPAPSLQAAPITPLRDGELRRVANMGPDGNDNDILVTRADDGFKAVIEGRYSDDDPRLTRRDWHFAPTLHALYVRLGDSLGTPPPWLHPELAPTSRWPRPI